MIRSPTDPASPVGPAILRLDPARAGSDESELLTDLPSDHYDEVVADGLLHRVLRPAVALACWVRVVRPGGLLVLTVGSGAAAPVQDPKWLYTVRDPLPPPGHLNLMELVETVCHLVEFEGLSSEIDERTGARSVKVVLRKRPTPRTPEQSNQTAEAIALETVARRAIEARALWAPMGEFRDILATGVTDATVVDLGRLYLLYQWLVGTAPLDGDCMEIGCFRGGTAKLVAETIRARGMDADLHLFDTFSGMPDRLNPDEVGLRGCFAETSVEGVRALIGPNERVHLYPGVFPDSVPPGLDALKLRFVHIDVDIESSVESCLDFVYPRLVPGGVIVIDDFGHSECPGATRAAERFFAGRPETIVHMPLVSSAVILKKDAGHLQDASIGKGVR